MYLFGFLALVLVGYFLFFNKKATIEQGSSKPVLPAKVQDSKQGATTFDSPIPTGYQIFAKSLPVAGMAYRKSDAIKFSRANNQELSLEREPSNQHDPNAIKLIGISGSNKFFIGYLPKELSEQIVATGLFDNLRARLTRIYVGKDDFLEFHYQIVGPKVEKKKFDDFLNNQPADSEQKEYFKFFGLPIPKSMTSGQAEKIIKEHKKISGDDEKDEWFGYTSIVEEFDDADFRETYALKKVGKTVLLEVLNQLKQEGKTYSYLGENIQEVVDRVIRVKPELEQKM